VRHAESEANLERAFLSRDLHHPLTPRGELQARAVAPVLAEALQDGAMLLSSPSTRALQTARILAEPAGGKEVVVLDDLHEVDVGDLDGRSERDEENMSRFLATVDRFRREEPGAAFEGGESLEGILERCARIEGELAVSRAPTVVAVSHCLFLCGLIPWLTGARVYDYRGSFVKKASITILDGEPGRMRLLKLGDLSHLS